MVAGGGGKGVSRRYTPANEKPCRNNHLNFILVLKPSKCTSAQAAEGQPEHARTLLALLLNINTLTFHSL